MKKNPIKSTDRRLASRYNSYYIYRFLEGFVLIYPVYMLLFRDRGFDFTNIALLIVIWASPVVLLEIPSGAFADRWSRKAVLAVGMAFKAAGILTWWLLPGFAGAALGFIGWGVQEALCSGTQEAFLYDRLKFHRLAHRYDQVAGRGGFFMSSGIALSVLLGGFLFVASPTLTLILSAVSCLAATAVALLFREPPRPKRTVGESAHPTGRIGEAFREAFRNKTIFTHIAVGCLAGSAYGLIDEYDSLWGTMAAGVPVLFIGVWMAFRFGLEALGARAAARLREKLSLDGTGRFRAYLFIAGASLAAAALLPALIGLPFYFLFYFMMAAGAVLVEQRLQDAIERAGRATVLSINSLITTLAAMAMVLGLGPLADALGLPAMLVAAGALTAAGALVLRSSSAKTAAETPGHGGRTRKK